MARSLELHDLQKLTKGYNFAAIKHTRQRRKNDDQIPYVNHPIGVVAILTGEGNVHNVDILVGAVLHDTVEDTDTTFDEIQEHFGERICRIVKQVTDDKSLPKEERKRLQVVNSPNACYEARIVKLADKLYNLRDLSKSTPIGWTEERVQQYFEWAKDVVDGIRGTHPLLESKLDEVFRDRGLL